MANEAALRNRTGLRTFDVTVDDTVAIPKGSLMQLSSDPRTATISSADNETFIGIAMHEKIADDGRTHLTVGRGGIWDIKDSSAGMSLGDICCLAGVNLVKTADDAGAQGANENVGMVLETATASEVVQVLVYP